MLPLRSHGSIGLRAATLEPWEHSIHQSGMRMEDTSTVQKSSSEGFRKKTKKGSKRKACFNAEISDADKLPDYSILDVEAQLMYLGRNKGREKTLEDTSREETQANARNKDSRKRELVECNTKLKEAAKENMQDEGLKQRKRVKFNSECTTIAASNEESGHSVQIKAQDGNATKEKKELIDSDTTWVQKASWKSLVGETGRVTFSLGSKLNPIVEGNGKPFTLALSRNNVSAWIDGSPSAPLLNNEGKLSEGRNTSNSILKSDIQDDLRPLQKLAKNSIQGGFRRILQDCESSGHLSAQSPDTEQVVQKEHQSGNKVCAFMRSDTYEQEWLEAKRAVKEIFKRSRKDALRSMKMFHTKHKN